MTEHAMSNSPERPRGIHVLAKPMGPVCQIKCDYCFYLEKRALFGQGEDYRMPDDVLAAYTAQYLRSQPTAEVEFVWHGGEPTQRGLDFFRKAVALQAPAGGGNGTVIAQGGRFGGWSLYVKNGVPGYDYNFLGLQRTSVVSATKLAAGKAEGACSSTTMGAGLAKAAWPRCSSTAKGVGQGRIPVTEAGLFSADETADVGIDLGTPVVDAIGAEAKSRFTGRIPRVTVEVK